jgi:hypothetical protein
MKLCIIMLVTVKKMSIVLQNQGQKDKILWAFLDEGGHTVIQVFSGEYPIGMEKYLKED